MLKCCNVWDSVQNVWQADLKEFFLVLSQTTKVLLSHCITLKISAKEKYIKIGSSQAHAQGYE